MRALAHEFQTPLFSISLAGTLFEHSPAIAHDDNLSRQVALIRASKQCEPRRFVQRRQRRPFERLLL